MKYITNLIAAEKKASKLFKAIEEEKIIIAGKTEEEINTEIYQLALKKFSIKKHWHKRIVRAGKNTVQPYNKNPKNRILEKDDIVFLDFGPLFDEWEADFGRTYVLGNDPEKIKIQQDIEKIWNICAQYYFAQHSITGKKYYQYIRETIKKFGYKVGGEIGGHLVGIFPHEHLEGDERENYIHRENNKDMFEKGVTKNPRVWILEIHIIHPTQSYGAFFEQLLVNY